MRLALKSLFLPVRGDVGDHVGALTLDGDVVTRADLIGGGTLGHEVWLPNVP